MKIFKAVLFYLWQFTFGITQNIMGLAMLAVCKMDGAESEWYHHALITYTDKKNFGGVSLGMFIFINKNRTGSQRHDTKIHEYGHTVQTMILGPLWLFVIAIPSVIWCNTPYFINKRKAENISYYWLYCEGWSNLCGLRATKEHFMTPELINKGRYGRPITGTSKQKGIKSRRRKK